MPPWARGIHLVRVDPEALRASLEDGMAALGLPVRGELSSRLIGYLVELERWNRAYNLTAIREPKDMVTRHLLDCLAVAPHVTGPLVDVGSGAGLPGVPLALFRPTQRVILLDASGKRARFLRAVVRALQMGNVEVVEARAEAWRAPLPADVALISRGLSRLAAFVLTTRHLGGAGARWLAMKGKLDAAELAELPEGFAIVDVIELHVPGLREARHLIVVRRSAAADAGRPT